MLHDTRLGRRTLFAGLGALAVTAGCSVDTGGTTSPAGTASAGAAKFEFNTAGVTLPSGNVSFRWIDSGDLKAKILEPVIKSFGEQHPNVAVTYDGAGWDQVNQVVPLGIRNNSAPDVFALPQNVPAQTAVAQGWVQPLDDLIPDFASWRKAFPDTALIPGVHVFEGKTYTFPLNSTRRLDKMLITNNELCKKAEVDPSAIKTWDDLRAAAKKATAAGKPGLLITGDHLSVVAMYLANTAGWHGNAEGMDMRTGTYVFSSPEFLSAIEFLKALVDDGSVIPGYLTLKDKDGRAQFPAGIAAMTFNGPWDIRAWKAQTANFDFGLHPVPSPSGGSYVIPFREVGANLAWVYAKTPVKEVAGVIMGYLGSVAGQSKMVELTGGTLMSIIPEANSKAEASLLDPHAKTAADLARTYMRACPQLEIRTSEAGKVRLELKATEPDIKTLMQGLFSGQVSDAKAALIDLDARLNQAMDAAFDAAKNKGAQVSRDLLAFPNWDPAKEYTKADYDALG